MVADCADTSAPLHTHTRQQVGGALGAKEVAAARSLLWDDIERLDDIQNADGGDAEVRGTHTSHVGEGCTAVVWR